MIRLNEFYNYCIDKYEIFIQTHSQLGFNNLIIFALCTNDVKSPEWYYCIVFAVECSRNNDLIRNLFRK